MRSRSARRRLGAVALASGALLGLPALATGASITLDRVPSPPQAITPTQAEQINYSVSWTSDPINLVLQVTPPVGAPVVLDNRSLTGQTSPAIGGENFVPGSGATLGRYRVNLDFFSNAAGPASPESSAQQIFDVAAALGSLQITKFEDINGNGTRNPGDPGLPGWGFDLVNPSGNPTGATTGPEGTILLTGVPAGTWTVSERPEAGWVPVSAPSSTVNVPANGTGSFQVGNVRPAPLSGTVWIDANRNQKIDPTEIGASGIKLTLTGSTGTGQPVSGTTFSGTDGSYEFPGLLPGTYEVKVARPGGFALTTTQTISGIPLTSGTPSPNHNFGIVRGGAPPVTPAGRPNPPELRIDKTGPAVRRRNVAFTFRIRITNPSRFTARDVVLIDPVPDSMTLVTRPRGARLVNGVLTWSLGTLGPRRSRTVNMRVRIRPGVPPGRYRNAATVTATGVPPASDTAIVRVVGAPRPPRSGGVTG
jgi:hypothetical protein